MSSGMNTEQAKEYAKTMTYTEAVSNIKHGKGIKYRKATMIKLRELAEIADRLDRKTEPQRGYMWTCPKCGTENHSDFTKCPCCGEPKDEPQTHEICTNTHECVKDTHDKTESNSEKPNNCEPQTENLFTDKYGDVWEWRGDAWYCISGQDEPQTERSSE